MIKAPGKELLSLNWKSSARDWNRTSTSLRTADFESAASTNSATRAYIGRQYYNFIAFAVQDYIIFYHAYLQQLLRGKSSLRKNLNMEFKVGIE